MLNMFPKISILYQDPPCSERLGKKSTYTPNSRSGDVLHVREVGNMLRILEVGTLTKARRSGWHWRSSEARWVGDVEERKYAILVVDVDRKWAMLVDSSLSALALCFLYVSNVSFIFSNSCRSLSFHCFYKKIFFVKLTFSVLRKMFSKQGLTLVLDVYLVKAVSVLFY